MPYENLDWDKDKNSMLSYISAAMAADEDYFYARKHAICSIGCREDAACEIVECEKEASRALRKLCNVYLDEYFGFIGPEEARRRAEPHLVEYNSQMIQSLKIQALSVPDA